MHEITQDESFLLLLQGVEEKMTVEDGVWGCVMEHRSSSMLGSTFSLFGSEDPERGESWR